MSNDNVLFDDYGLTVRQAIHEAGNCVATAEISDATVAKIVETLPNEKVGITGSGFWEKNIVHPVYFVLDWALLFVLVYFISFLFSLLFWLDVGEFYSPVAAIVVSLALTLKPNPHAPNFRNNFSKKVEKKRELFTREAAKQITTAVDPKRVVVIDTSIVHTLANFLKLDYADKAGVVSLVKQKIELDEGGNKLRNWIVMVTSIFAIDKNFPVIYVPVMNDVASEVLDRLVMKKQVDDEAAAVEDRVRREIQMGYAARDSSVAITGAFAYLGVDSDEPQEKENNE